MIACFDVHYFEDHANAAVVMLDDWSDIDIIASLVVRCDSAREYVAGQFYQREPQPLLSLIKQIEHPIQTYVVDAYCHLSKDGTPGLGQYLYDELDSDKPVIGVAKNRFRDTHHAVELLRGESIRPLFVSSVGIDYAKAANLVNSMHGRNRIPTLLKKVDHLSRHGE